MSPANAALIFSLVAVACALFAVFAATRTHGPGVILTDTHIDHETKGE